MEINSELDTNYITYDFKSSSISKLSKQKKDFYIKCIKNHLSYSINEYNLRNLSDMDTVLFAFSEDSFNQDNKNLLIITLLNLIETIEESDYYAYQVKQKIELNDLDKGIYNVSYKEMCAIVNFIIKIIKSIKKKQRGQIFASFYFDGIIPDLDIEIYGVKLIKLKNYLDLVKIINICLSDKNANFIEIKNVKNRIEVNKFVIKLFFMFFKAFFKNVLYLNLDLNVYEINNYFNKESNPYNIKETTISTLCKSCDKIFLGNLIILKNISKFNEVTNIKYFLSDSYYIEFYQILYNRLFNNPPPNQNSINTKVNNNKEEDIQTLINKFTNKIIYFDYLIQKEIRPYLEFNFDINALDPFLFLKMNLLIYQYKSVINTSINFFKQEINMRKILLNNFYFDKYLQIKDKDVSNPPIKFNPNKINNKFENDYKIYYNHINNINDYNNKLLLRDEEIPNELFPYFNYNLNLLLFVLVQKFKSDKNLQNSLLLNFQTNNNGIIDIHSYNNYNCAILSFLFNLFCEIELNSNLENISSLEIYLDDLCDKKEYILKYIFDTFRKNNPFNFNKIKLTKLLFDIPNITLILPFENFPCNNLMEMTLINLSYNDIKNIANTLIQKKQKFKKLITLDLRMGYILEEYKQYLKVILTENICDKLTNFSMEIPWYINTEDILDIFSWIKISKNKKCLYFLKLSNEELNQNLGNNYFFNTVNKFKEKIKKDLYQRNLLTNIACLDNKTIHVKIKTINKDINYILNIIFCFEKKLGNKNKKIFDDINKAKIFENIFYFMGKFSDKEKKINIEFI